MNLIETVTSQLGIPAVPAEGAVGSVLAAIKQSAPADAAAAIDEKVPEAAQWAAARPWGALGGLLK